MLRLFSKPKPEPAGPRPRAARDAIACSATLCDGNRFHRAQLCDVSKTGCKVRLAHQLRPGDRVQIALEAYHSLAGTIRWYRDGMAGIQFARPMSDAALGTWRNAITSARSQPGGVPGRRKNFLGEWVEDSNRPTLREICRPSPLAAESDQCDPDSGKDESGQDAAGDASSSEGEADGADGDGVSINP